MAQHTYSISDLASLADVTPRTIRYYVSQGLLPAPGAAGPATRYAEGHLARLRLIRRLQRDHLPLAEIRSRLERMADEDVRTALAETPEVEATAPAETLAFVRDLMARSRVAPRLAAESTPAYPRTGATFEPIIPDGFPARAPESHPSSPSGTPVGVPMPASVPGPPGPRTNVGDRTTWEHHVLARDVELHVRRPLDRLTAKRVERLLRVARELLDEE